MIKTVSIETDVEINVAMDDFDNNDLLDELDQRAQFGRGKEKFTDEDWQLSQKNCSKEK